MIWDLHFWEATEAMDQEVLDEFLSGFDDSRYPDAFLQDYEAMECLSSGPLGETLLVRSRRTGTYFVAKCYADQSLLPRSTEGELLKRLHHCGLPAFTGEYRNDRMLCVVREYAKGIPLDKLAEGKRSEERQIISIGLKLCDILTYMHGQTPPVIHRDIKPQNIIVGEDGEIKLIDLGISRAYDKSARNDTVLEGTQEFAPPEQYGFSQTDNRSDLFSLGVVLCWLLTGETDVGKAASRIPNRRLAHIVKKCTSFAPKDRYPRAESVRRALENADGHRRKRICRVCCAATALFLALSVGFAAGRFTDIGAPVPEKAQAVTFSEPLIEQAIRLRLGKGAGDRITEDELLTVTELYVFGDKAAADENDFAAYETAFAGGGQVLRGSIASLSDLGKMKNLRRLSLSYQNIRDLTPLGQLSWLEHVELKHNPLEDVSPLSHLSSLRELYLFDTNISDLTCLSGCTRLEDLNAGLTQIKSMAALDGLSSLKTLTMDRAPLETLDHIGSHTLLETLAISETSVGDLTPLLELPRLRTVTVSEGMREAADAVAGKAGFELEYQ